MGIPRPIKTLETLETVFSREETVSSVSSGTVFSGERTVSGCFTGIETFETLETVFAANATQRVTHIDPKVLRT